MKKMKINVNQIVSCIESLLVTDILLLKIRKLFIHNRLSSLLFCVLLKCVFNPYYKKCKSIFNTI